MAKDDPAEDASHSDQPRDVALIHGVTEQGDLRILRQREDRLELGEVRRLREGVPINGEVVRLTPRKEFPLLCDVKTEVPVAETTQDVRAPSPLGHKGPAHVTTDRYRDNWDRIWSRGKTREGLVN